MINYEIDTKKLKTSKTVQDYKIEQGNKYSFGMAINNAAVILANKNFDRAEMKAQIEILFELYKEIRKEKLGY